MSAAYTTITLPADDMLATAQRFVEHQDGGASFRVSSANYTKAYIRAESPSQLRELAARLDQLATQWAWDRAQASMEQLPGVPA